MENIWKLNRTHNTLARPMTASIAHAAICTRTRTLKSRLCSRVLFSLSLWSNEKFSRQRSRCKQCGSKITIGSQFSRRELEKSLKLQNFERKRRARNEKQTFIFNFELRKKFLLSNLLSIQPNFSGTVYCSVCCTYRSYAVCVCALISSPIVSAFRETISGIVYLDNSRCVCLSAEKKSSLILK